jgi:hypothetical protein
MAPSIGIDFDNCLVETYSIFPFILLFEFFILKDLKAPGVSKLTRQSLERARITFYSKIADNEVQTGGTMFRPTFLKLLPEKLKLRQQGKLNKIFIYSNNGYNKIIDTVDHILALVLQKQATIDKSALITNEKDGMIHALYPRINLDNPCRSSEERIENYRGKSLVGIQACLGQQIDAKDLWYIDDTFDHPLLKNELGSNYIKVEPYTVRLGNTKLTEMFIDAFPISVFSDVSPTGTVLINSINSLLTGFRPTSRDGRDAIIKKFKSVLNKFSKDSIRAASIWAKDKVDKDLNLINTRISGAMLQPTHVNTVVSNIVAEYKTPIVGGRQRGILPISSLSRKTRRLRKDLK